MSTKALTGIFLGLITAFSSLSASKGDVTYDYIIVGNGTAGAVLARKLSDSGKKSVLVLEAGVNQDNDPVVLNTDNTLLFQGFTALTYNPKYAMTYPIELFQPLTATQYSQGIGWGGNSKHNYMQVVRGTPDIYDAWATISGNPMWSYANMLPMMLALTNFTACMTTPNLAQEGVGGPISITQTIPVTGVPGTFEAALNASTGTPFVADINDPTLGLIGISAFQYFATADSPCNPGIRSFSSNEFLPPSVLKPTSTGGIGTSKRLLRIESNCWVNNVIFDGKKAIGVRFIYNNQPGKTLKAYGKKIILCAGGINTPAILQRSGIGDPAVLGPLGIKVRVNNPNVGANLINQYGGSAIALGITDAVPIFQAFINGSTTPPQTPPFAYPNDMTRRIQIDAIPAGPGVLQILPFILEPQSRGSVQIVSTNPLVQPQVNLNMYSDGPVTTNGTDANLTVTAYYILQQTLGAGNILYPTPTQYATPAGLLAAAQAINAITPEEHIVGTAAMGTSASNSVVDGNLHVHGVKNLMVVDSSAIPVSPNGNICFGVYVLALGGAAILGVPTPPAL
jgi:choline dehydrogenase-like flavoprotein